MSIRQFLLHGTSFDPEAIERMSQALAGARTSLRVKNGNSDIHRLLAQTIIDRARQGERDPERLKAAALRRVRN
jgi:hypothetical protein